MYYADKMYFEMKELENKLRQSDPCDAKSIAEYFRDYTTLIYNYKWVGSLYDIYADDVIINRENGYKLIGADAVVADAMQFMAAFPDCEVTFADCFAYPEEDGTYSVWRFYYLDGTNQGFSKFGAPTGKSLENKKSMCESMATVKKIGGTWRILYEKAMMSSEWIKTVCTPDA